MIRPGDRVEDVLKKMDERLDRLENIIYTLFKASLQKEDARRRANKKEKTDDKRNSGS